MFQAEGTTRAKAQRFEWQKKGTCDWTILKGADAGGKCGWSQTALGFQACQSRGHWDKDLNKGGKEWDRCGEEAELEGRARVRP